MLSVPLQEDASLEQDEEDEHSSNQDIAIKKCCCFASSGKQKQPSPEPPKTVNITTMLKPLPTKYRVYMVIGRC